MLTPEQQAIRARRIGSSEVGVLLGVDPSRTPVDLFAAKTLGDSRESSPEMEWGSEVEASILRWYASARKVRLSLPGTLVHPTRALLCATPDALAEEAVPRVVEVKNVGHYRRHQWGDDADEIPTHYAAQVVWEIGVSQAVARAAGSDVQTEGHLVAAIAGEPPRIYPVAFDADVFGVIADRAEKFLRDHVQTGIPPEGWERDRSALDYVAKRWRKGGAEKLAPTEHLTSLVASYRSLAETAKALEEEKDAAKALLCAAIGEAGGIEGLCTWGTVPPSTALVTDWEAIARDCIPADVLAERAGLHTKEVVTRAGHRRLTLKKVKEAAHG